MRKEWGIALGVSTLMLSAIPGLALASTHHVPAVRAVSARHLIRPGHAVMVWAKPEGLRGPLEYGFRVTTATGHQVALRRMAKSSRFSFKPSRPGTYWIQARVMTETAAQKKAWNQETVSPLAAVYVGSGPSVGLSSHSVALGGTVKLTAHSRGIAHPQYELQSRSAGGRWVSLTKKFGPKIPASLTPSQPGRYQVRLLAKTPGGPGVYGQPVNFSIYGAPSAISLTTNRKEWVADGRETEVLTACVVDAKGDVVSDYQGIGYLQDSSANGAIAEWGPERTRLAAVTNGATLPLTFVNGQALVVLQAGSTAASDSLTATSTSTKQVLAGKTTITAAVQQATAIHLTTDDRYIIANESGNPATYNLSVVDQVGEPMLAGTYNLAANIAGPGQFKDLTQGPDKVTYTGGGSPTTITVVSIAAALGRMTLTVSGNGFAAKAITMLAILGGQPAQMGVSAAKTSLTDGESTNLTLTQLTNTGGVSDPASLDNSGYVVSITDANGNPASGFSLGGTPYTGTSQSFAVATGPNYFYAVSQPVTLSVTNAVPGTYKIVVADANGLWKPSNPLTISVTK